MLKEALKAAANCVIKRPKSSILPYNVVIENTSRCNLRCQHCWRKVVENPQDMPFSLYKRIIDEIRPKKVNIIGNGEPFLHSEIFDFIEYAKHNSCLVYTSTNGTLIDQKKADAIVDLHIDSIGVSIDAVKPETYSKIRGGNVERVFDCLTFLSEAKRKKNKPEISVGVAFLIQKDNFQEIEEFAKKINQYDGVDFISFQRLKFLSEELRKSKDLLGDITYENISQRLDRLRNSLRVQIQYDSHVADKMWKKNINSCGVSFTKKCIQPWYSVYISATGDVLPCCFFSATKNISMGNLHNKSFKEIWNNEDYQKFRKALKQGKIPFEVCAECYPFGIADYFKIEKRFLKMFFKQVVGKGN